MPSTVPPTTPCSAAWALLRSGVPLTLLLDLLRPDPGSAELYRTERPNR